MIFGGGDAQGRDMAEDDTDGVPKAHQTHGLNRSMSGSTDCSKRKPSGRPNQPDSNYQAGQLVLSQLVGCPLGGGIVGWLLDRWLGTKPWLMLVMLFLGFAVGVWNVIRISNEASRNARGEKD